MRQPDDGVFLTELALHLVDAAHIVGRVPAGLVERIVDDHADRARLGLELDRRHPVGIADVVQEHLDDPAGATPGHLVERVERALVLEVQLCPEHFPDELAAG